MTLFCIYEDEEMLTVYGLKSACIRLNGIHLFF